MPNAWQLQDAKARFSEVTRKALSEGPQHITLHGRPSVVVLSEKDFEHLGGKKGRPSFVEFFGKSAFKGAELDLKRNRDTGRTVKF